MKKEETIFDKKFSIIFVASLIIVMPIIYAFGQLHGMNREFEECMLDLENDIGGKPVETCWDTPEGSICVDIGNFVIDGTLIDFIPNNDFLFDYALAMCPFLVTITETEDGFKITTINPNEFNGYQSSGGILS